MPVHRLILAIVIILVITSCGGKPNKPPYGKDLAKGVKYYSVQKGDTLFSIGYRSGHGYKRIAQWNNIRPPYTIKVGQKIKLFDPKKNSQVKSKKNNTVLKNRDSSQKRLSKSNNIIYESKIKWQWPIKGKLIKTFTQTGYKGIDIKAHPGLSVKAAAVGKVVYSGQGLIGYGNLVIIKHNEEYLSAYANNRRLLVKEGQRVKLGQTIAELGDGADNKATLHFEIRKKGKPVNPLHYLP